jgi:alpha-D-ribose 1-methylphosphonate 5-triphosphate synthase subunit PhnG
LSDKAAEGRMSPSEVIAEGRLEAITRIGEYVATRARVRVVRPPRPAMVMVRHVDPLERTPFHLGEAYVTECEVEVDGVPGYGCCTGREEARALAGAIVDAAVGGGHALASEVFAMVADEERAIEERWSLERRALSRTRVDFDVR